MPLQARKWEGAIWWVVYYGFMFDKLTSFIFLCHHLDSDFELLKTFTSVGIGVHIQYMPTKLVYEAYVHGYILR